MIEDTLANILNSDVFSCILSEDYKKDLRCATEFGYALLNDKPLLFLVKKGTAVPDLIKKIAAGIEYCDPDDPEDMKRASLALGMKIKEIKESK